MITIFLIFVLVFTTVLLFSRENNHYDYLNSILISMFITVILLIPIAYISQLPFIRHEEKEVINLYSAYTDNQTIGRFYFLGGGTIDDVDYVFYLTDYGSSGGIKKYKFETEKSVFFEEDRKDGYAVSKTFVCNDKSNLWLLCVDHPVYEMEFHVPQGSILFEYSVK